MRPLIALLLFALPVLAAPVPKALKKNNSPDGHWYLKEFNGDGKPDTTLNGFRRHVLIEGERYSCAAAGRPDGSDSTNWTIRDPEKPHLRTWGKMPAVYEVEGDTLRCCYAHDGRPELTECKPGQGIHYYVYERVKEK
jgi:hypothetical protein